MNKRFAIVLFVGILFLLVGALLSFLFPNDNGAAPSIEPPSVTSQFRVFREQGTIGAPSSFSVVLPKNPGLPAVAPQYGIVLTRTILYQKLGGLFGYVSSPSGALFQGTTTAYWSTKTSGLSFSSTKNGWGVSYQISSSPTTTAGTKEEEISAFAGRVSREITSQDAFFVSKKIPLQSEGLVSLDVPPSSLLSFSIVQQSPNNLPVIVDYNQSAGQAIVDPAGFLRFFSLSSPVVLVDTKQKTRLLPYADIARALEAGSGVIIGSSENTEGSVALSFSRFAVSSVSLVYAVDSSAGVVYPAYLCIGTGSGKGETRNATFLLRADTDTTTPVP